MIITVRKWFAIVTTMSNKAVFLDRDGTITVGTPIYDRVDSLEKVQLLPNTLEALKLLASLDYMVFIITNQAGIAEGLMSLDEFNEINGKVLSLIGPSGVVVQKTYLCPHGERDNCDCRKPKPKLLLDAAKDYAIDLTASWMVGDRPTDVMTGVNAGTRTVLVRTGVPTVESDKATATRPSLLEAVMYIKQAA
jgi:D-glycero-D-manno-heptose 1,7-bisphosphate phosphatase